MSMLDEYEESFYYDKPSSTGTNVSGEAVGMGLGLGAGIVTGLLSGIMLLLTRLDILSSGILGLLFYMLTYKNGWPAVVYIFAVVAIIAASVILQHRFIVVRIIYGVFMCVVASLLGPAIIGYDSEVRMYTIMAICCGVTAIMEFISWHVETVVLLSQQKPNDRIEVNLDLDDIK